MASYYTPMTLNESMNNWGGGCNTTLDCPQQQECWPYPTPQDGNMGQCQCFYVFNLDGPTCTTTSGKNWFMWFFYLTITFAHRGAAIYATFWTLLRLKKLEGWLPITAQMIMLWMLFAESTFGLLSDFIQSFDFLGVTAYDGQQEFTWVSNFQQSMEIYERLHYFNGDGRTNLCGEVNRVFLSSFEYYDYDNNPMVEPGTNMTRLSRQGRLVEQDASWLSFLLFDVFKLGVLENLHYMPLLFANVLYINIVRASNSLKKATKGLGCLKWMVIFALANRAVGLIFGMVCSYLTLTVTPPRGDRQLLYEYPYWGLLFQMCGDLIGLSVGTLGWGMLVSMMIPKEKRTKPLDLLIRALHPVATGLVALFYVSATLVIEKPELKLTSAISKEVWGIDFKYMCGIFGHGFMNTATLLFYIWLIGANAVIVWFYTGQIKKESADMTPAQQQAKQKKSNFMKLILFVFFVDLGLSYWYSGLTPSVLWDNPFVANSNPQPFHFALSGAAYHSHQDGQRGECSFAPYGFYHFKDAEKGVSGLEIKIVNSTVPDEHLTWYASQCFFLTDAPWPGQTPPVSNFNRDASFFGTWILILGNRIMHTIHAIIVILPVFVSARRRYLDLKKVKPNSKKVKAVTK